MEAAKLILKYSKAEGVSTGFEWPMIIHCKSEMTIKYLRETEQAGGYEH
jgi:hypothetical protein